jgi:uncharacterized RDD family membrane protein YckC
MVQPPKAEWWQDESGRWRDVPRAAGAAAVPDEAGVCPVCGSPWGAGPACASCRQVGSLPGGVRLSSLGRRFAAYAIDVAIGFVTLGIGWLIWALIVFARGQTPGKQLLGMRTLTWATRRRAGWGRMFLRVMVVQSVIMFVAIITLIGVVVFFWPLWDDRNQELWDKVVDTVVVDDQQELV